MFYYQLIFLYELLTFWGLNHDRRSRVRELWCHIDTLVATGWNRPLPLQCLRSLLQDERTESTSHQTQTTPGKYLS